MEECLSPSVAEAADKGWTRGLGVTEVSAGEAASDAGSMIAVRDILPALVTATPDVEVASRCASGPSLTSGGANCFIVDAS